jgi:hypothetical protein
MREMQNVGQERLIAASKLFSSAVLQELARRGRSSLFAGLLRQSDLLRCAPHLTLVGDAFESAFALLRQEGNRDEYVYKAALVRRILLGRHSLRTASVLTEFRVSECKADVVILNGTSTVYEIKSERDSLSRLDRQVEAYRNVFARVYVVAAEDHLDSVWDTVSPQVGIIQLSKRFQLTTIREAPDSTDYTSPALIFDSIRTDEARMILRLLGVPVPKVPNTLLCAALRESFIKLTPREAHNGMVEVLRHTRAQSGLSELLARLPTSLHTAALCVPLRKSDHARLVEAVNTQLEAALAWG